MAKTPTNAKSSLPLLTEYDDSLFLLGKIIELTLGLTFLTGLWDWLQDIWEDKQGWPDLSGQDKGMDYGLYWILDMGKGQAIKSMTIGHSNSNDSDIPSSDCFNNLIGLWSTWLSVFEAGLLVEFLSAHVVGSHNFFVYLY
jgi:hypothetical protein